MKTILSAIILLIAVSLPSIDCLPGSGRAVESCDRDYQLSYHNSTDDLHFYGTDFWAVRFDFANYYFPTLQNLSFTIQALRLWFPQTGDTLRVKLMTDVDNQPGLPVLAELATTVTSNQTVLPLATPVMAQQVWMLVEYHTNYSTRFVSASRGGGGHSYYLNSSMGTSYYQSLADAGFSAELLFGVQGEFVDLNDLRLQSLALDGIVETGSRVYPRFSIHNHSSQPLTSVNLNLSLLTTEEESNISRTIQVPDIIPAYGDLVWDSTHPGYYDQAIDLPSQPMQMRLRGILGSELGPTDYSANNTLDRYYYTFSDTTSIQLVENFFRSSHASALLGLEDQILSAEQYRSIHPLTYFPILADSLSSSGAMTRFNWYGFNALPRVVFGGSSRMMGFDAGFADAFQARCDTLLAARTFVSSGSLTANYSADRVDFRLEISNANTGFLSGTGIYDLVGNTQLFLGLFKRAEIDDRWCWVLDRWISYATPPGQSLNLGESLELQATMARVGLDADTQYRAYYWLQDRYAGPVYYAGSLELSFPVEVDDDLVPSLVLKASPNPLTGRSALQLSMAGMESRAEKEIRIYNLRGQMIHTQTTFSNDPVISPAVFDTSGIYLIKVSSKVLGSKSLSTKICVIK